MRVRVLLSSLVTGAFFALVSVMAFRPRWLERPVYGDIVSLGLFASLAFLLLSFLVMGGYVWWRERCDRGEP